MTGYEGKSRRAGRGRFTRRARGSATRTPKLAALRAGGMDTCDGRPPRRPGTSQFTTPALKHPKLRQRSSMLPLVLDTVLTENGWCTPKGALLAELQEQLQLGIATFWTGNGGRGQGHGCLSKDTLVVVHDGMTPGNGLSRLSPPAPYA